VHRGEAEHQDGMGDQRSGTERDRQAGQPDGRRGAPLDD
jgi:hypothetical protein